MTRHAFVTYLTRPLTDWRAVILLSVFVLIYIFKFFHSQLILQTDMFLNLYLWHFTDLIEPNWDPHILGYTGWYPILGKLFPTTLLLRCIGRFLFPGSLIASLVGLLTNSALLFWGFNLSFYLFFRYLKQSPGAALLATVITTFAGFIPYSGLRETNYFYSISASAVPLAIICVCEALKQRHKLWVGLLTLVIGVSLLGGSNFPLFFYLPCLPFAWLLDGPLPPRDALKKTAKAFAYTSVATLVGTLLSAHWVLPMLVYGGYSNRHATAALDQGVIDPSLFSETIIALFNPYIGNPNGSLFLSLPAVLLALFGLVRLRHRRGTFFFAFLFAYLALWYQRDTLGEWIHTLLRSYLRFASLRLLLLRYAILFPAMIGFFAGAAYDQKFAPNRRQNPISLITFVFLCGALAAYAYWLWIPIRFDRIPARREALTIISLSVVSLIPFLKRCLRFLWIPLVFAIACTSNIDKPLYYLQENNVPPFEKIWPLLSNPFNAAFTATIKSHPLSSFRYLNFMSRRNFWAATNGIDIAFDPASDSSSPIGLMGLLAAGKHRFDATKIQEPQLDGEVMQEFNANSPILDLYNVRYIQTVRTTLLGEDPKSLGQPELPKKFIPTLQPGVFENKEMIGRFFITPYAKWFDSETDLFRALHEATRDDVLQAVYLKKEPTSLHTAFHSNQCTDRNEITVLNHTEKSTTLDVYTPQRGYLNASDLWFPAWKVTVDGVPTPVLRGYGAFRTVPLSSGRHRIHFYYSESYWIVGLTISMVAFAIIAFFFTRQVCRWGDLMGHLPSRRSIAHRQFLFQTH